MIAFLLNGCTGIPDIKVSSGNPELSRDQSGLTLYRGKLYDGYVVEKYLDGSTKVITPFRKGLQESVKKGYYPTGELKYERPYKNGEKHGVHKGYFPDGSTQFVYHFEDGTNVGTHRDWYASGQLAKLMNFKDGKPFGEQKVWRSDGKIRANYVIREDGRRYGLVGMKRCKNLDTEKEAIKPLTAAVYEND